RRHECAAEKPGTHPSEEDAKSAVKRRNDMATVTTTQRKTASERGRLVEMVWDPITRIVGSLGLYTRIDFEKREVAECFSTSSIFRGYSIFMKGKDPRDAHFITSRICGICGDNHATCSCYTQQMAYGVRPPAIGEWIVNLGEAAEYMFDHNIFQENLVGVDFCEKMVRETNPGVWERAQRTQAPGAQHHGYRTIGDIMRSLNPFEGEFYREALVMSRLTREMFCLMEGRHVHPSTLYPGGVGTMATIQTFTDYLVRLMKYVEFMKKVVPMHDDLFNFFYDALPGYEKVGQRRVLLGCWGAFQDPEVCNFKYRDMTEWGRKMFVTPGVIVDGKLVTNDLVKINLGIRILLGSSYYEDWDDQKMYVRQDELGNPVDRRHPWNQHTIPRPQKRNFDDKYTWVMSPRWYDGTDFLPLDTGGGPIARLWSTALSGLVDIGYVKATGNSVRINLPKTALKPEMQLEWKIPQWSNAIERDRARTYFQAYAAACALHFINKALDEIRTGHTKTWEPFQVPEEGFGCGFTEAVRGVLSHHLVIRDRKIANYHPYPPTPWNASPRDSFGTPGPYEDAIQHTPIFEESSRDNFKGIDIMRAVRSFDPCLPCGVHMYLGGGKTIETRHSPTLLNLAS
ncbi:MAG TPA: nickel-dependent hydrogenase large subunit, partial [Vicinamibacterales bacterium]